MASVLDDFTLTQKDEAPDPDEIAGAFAVGRGSKNEDDLWDILAKAWDKAFEQALVECVADGLAEPQVRLAALTCVAERAAGRLPRICQQLADAGQEGRQVEIAMDLGEMRQLPKPIIEQRLPMPMLSQMTPADRCADSLDISFEELARSPAIFIVPALPVDYMVAKLSGSHLGHHSDFGCQ